MKIAESQIEKFAIELLEKQGYQYIYAPSIAPDSDTPERQSFEDVLLMERLQSAVGRINPSIPADIREDAIKQIQRLNSPELIANNEAFHRMLTEGIKVGYQKDGYNRGDLVWLIDFKNPENNDFLVANQFTVIENNINKRPDVILFVNGLPLVVIELKNPADENATIRSAFKQLQTYKQEITGLFTYNGFMIISDGLEAKAGSISAEFTRFMAWKTSDGKVEASPLIGQLETLIKGMLNKKTLLDLIRHFLLEVKNMELKNIALEVLKKLLNDEIKTRTKKNLIQSKSLMVMLENSIKKYHNKILTAAEVIEELIKLSKEIQKMDKEPQGMGMSDFEYAFYTAIANNDSAREVMEKDKLRELAVVLFEKVKANASIDWTIKESVKAKLKVIVKRTLRQYGYPPDMQKLATETVLKQAELIAEEITCGE